VFALCAARKSYPSGKRKLASTLVLSFKNPLDIIIYSCSVPYSVILGVGEGIGYQHLIGRVRMAKDLRE
jgi:hypothetical protein